ncbi:MAG: hypothetical protein IPP27_04750 [Bacteroidetes bacterium]|nr:hypothetical protein [Bacteroidota bacterium]MBK9415075.1 hypothetical protein [Bacteroidota bacterium]MBL0031507.1 hypothetical protein [Bacteroidota bacterium]MBP6426053.1 hypothetical protein [Bacteroidia bacterium]MBP6656332.1 hypothetical protein [Bacteroidia bacterium]
MNLFHNPTLTELNSLIDRFVKEPTLTHLTVDNDGEVLLIAENADLTSKLDKFKFYVRDLRMQKCIRTGSLKDIRLLRMLYNRLMYSWRKDLRGNLADLIINPLNNQVPA